MDTSTIVTNNFLLSILLQSGIIISRNRESTLFEIASLEIAKHKISYIGFKSVLDSFINYELDNPSTCIIICVVDDRVDMSSELFYVPSDFVYPRMVSVWYNASQDTLNRFERQYNDTKVTAYAANSYFTFVTSVIMSLCFSLSFIPYILWDSITWLAILTKTLSVVCIVAQAIGLFVSAYNVTRFNRIIKNHQMQRAMFSKVNAKAKEINPDAECNSTLLRVTDTLNSVAPADSFDKFRVVMYTLKNKTEDNDMQVADFDHIDDVPTLADFAKGRMYREPAKENEYVAEIENN